MKPQIEKVEHSNIYSAHNCCIIDYYPESDKVIQNNFSDENFAKSLSYTNTIGVWRIKELKN